MSIRVNIHACFYIAAVTFLQFCTVVYKLVLAWDQVICPHFLLVRLLSSLPAIFLFLFLNFMLALILLKKYIKTILKFGVLNITHILKLDISVQLLDLCSYIWRISFLKGVTILQQ
jgi:hypothetical protein